jgi:hypothetical protein
MMITMMMLVTCNAQLDKILPFWHLSATTVEPAAAIAGIGATTGVVTQASDGSS